MDKAMQERIIRRAALNAASRVVGNQWHRMAYHNEVDSKIKMAEATIVMAKEFEQYLNGDR